MLNSNFFILWA